MTLKIGHMAFLFFLLIGGVPCQSAPLSLHEGMFHVYYDAVDSNYARQAVTVLRSAVEELEFDLQYKLCEEVNIYISPSRKDFLSIVSDVLPPWTGAFAVPSRQVMYLKSPRWDKNNSFEQVLVHELTHLVMHDFVSQVHIPRWLDEGLAIYYAREKRWKTDTALSKAAATRSLVPLDQIEDILKYHRAKADLAYQQSYSAVSYLLDTYDTEAVREILEGLKDGLPLNDCFIQATGSSYAVFEVEWANVITKRHKWLWLSELEEYLWIIILGLFVLAFFYRFLRNRQTIRRWEEEGKRAEQESTLIDTEQWGDEEES
ncbi:MAG: hypothetical protein EHM72_00120 [Calditrichaeota bacterium]|nr:MAG: hypothetical protein EHM72_00120 [Calditrichota bacterium]